MMNFLVSISGLQHLLVAHPLLQRLPTCLAGLSAERCPEMDRVWSTGEPRWNSSVDGLIAVENHHFSWENPLFLWPFSIAMLVYQRVVNGLVFLGNFRGKPYIEWKKIFGFRRRFSLKPIH
jgi:hypothetical protein